MPDLAQPTGEPAEFVPVMLPDAEGSYVTIVARNHRIVHEGGPPEQPVLRREFLDADDFEAVTDSILNEIGAVDGLSLCFAGHGFDPSSVPAGDEEALEQSSAWAAVLFVPPGGMAVLRQAVSGALVDHGLDNAWLLPSAGDGDRGIVVRAAEHDPRSLAPAESESFYWYGAVPFPRRPDGTTVDLAESAAARAEIHGRIDALDDVTLLRCLRRAREVTPGFDPPGDHPAEATRSALHDIADEVLSDGYHRLLSRLCLEGTTFLLAGEASLDLAEHDFYAAFAALWASNVGDEPVDAAADGPPLSLDPAVHRLVDLVAWYADMAAPAVADHLGAPDASDLADRLGTRLAGREADALAALRAGGADEWHGVV